MKKLVPTAIIIGLMTLTGCGTQQATITKTPQPVKWTSVPTNEQKDIMRISNSYGDAHPKVMNIIKTQTDNNGKPMYLVHLGGNFHKGGNHYTHLEFSILANGSEIWATNLS